MIYRLLLIVKRHLNSINLISNGAEVGEGCFLENSTIQGKVFIGEGCKIYHSHVSGNVAVGSHTSIWGPNTTIQSHINRIVIGRYCSIARNVSIQESNHKIETITSYNILRNLFNESVEKDMVSKGDVNIGNDVWIGANAVIVSGVNIGNGAVIGAGAVVTSNIPDYAIAVGNPAKVINYRFNQRGIHLLQEIKWWDWPQEEILKNKELFASPLSEAMLEKFLKKSNAG